LGEESDSPDTLVIFTQKKERLEGGEGTLLKVARGFFRSQDFSGRLIAPPIPREEMVERLGSIEDFPKSINLLLIGHGYNGYFTVGGKSALDLNALKLPEKLSTKVEHVYLMHCTAGKRIAKIGKKTMENSDAWTSLQTISGNIYYNNWQSMGDVISRHGWTSGPDDWKDQAKKLLTKEGTSDRALDDFGLKNPLTYNADSILSPEGFHRTYNVQDGEARFSYRMPARQVVVGAAAAKGGSRDLAPAGPERSADQRYRLGARR
jgi:hypothetical protein